MPIDKDLQSIQEVRDIIAECNKAQEVLATFPQSKIDEIVCAMAEAAKKNADKWAKMAYDETGFGRYEDKIVKNCFAAENVYQYIKDMKTVGILKEDIAEGIMEIGVPMGVIAALIPSTNPTSTTIYKALIAIKSGNAIVFSPHPKALGCINETANALHRAAIEAGAPNGIIGTMTTLTMHATKELMRHKNTALILATGGEAMVRAAYSSGNPAIGVGPGNGPSFIEKSADIKLAVKRILASKCFDNGVICASEQSIIVEREISTTVRGELTKQGAYFVDDSQKEAISKLILRNNGTLNPDIVGKDAFTIAQMANITVPQNTRVIIANEEKVGKEYPFSREKLCPLLAYYEENDWNGACERSIEILKNEGIGHTMTIHSNNKEIIKAFALQKPVSRLLVNTAGSLGGIGATVNLPPALTLGCGAVGGSATSDNITPHNLINIRRVAYGVREVEDCIAGVNNIEISDSSENVDLQIEYITKLVMEELKKQQLV